MIKKNLSNKYKVDAYGTEEILSESSVSTAPKLTIDYGNATQDAEFTIRPTKGSLDTGIGESATLSSVKGNTVAWNQIFSYKTEYDVTKNGVRCYFSDNKYKLSGVRETAYLVFDVFDKEVSFINGHIYYIGGIKNSSTNKIRIWVESSIAFPQEHRLFDNGEGSLISNALGNETISRLSNLFIQIITSDDVSGITIEPKLIDLTLIYGSGNEPTTVSQFESDYYKWFGKPLTYEPYDAGSLRNCKMSGVKTVGINVWDEQWEVGGIDHTTGQNRESTTAFRQKNYTPCLPNFTYYINKAAFVHFYDSSYNYISYLSIDRAFTTPLNAKYIRFNGTTNYGPTYNNNICISLSSSKDGTYEPYRQSITPMPVTTMKGKLNAIRWNQLASMETNKWSGRRANVAVDGNVVTVSPNSESGIHYVYQSIPLIVDHKYYSCLETFSTTAGVCTYWYYGDATQYTKEDCTASELNMWIKRQALFTCLGTQFRQIRVLEEAEATGDVKGRDVQCFDLTEIYGAGNEPSTVEQFEADYQAWFGTALPDYSAYDAGTLKAVPVVAGTTVNAGLDATTVFPEGLKSAGSVYDEIKYENGVYKAVKRIGTVDLGTLNWIYNGEAVPSTVRRFYAIFYLMKYIADWNKIGATLSLYSQTDANVDAADHSWGVHGRGIYIKDLTYETESDFKSAMSGVMLNYELATPEEYVIEPMSVGKVMFRLDANTTKEVTKMYLGNQVIYQLNNSRLPSGYTEVEYIASTATGGQYIDLGLQMWSVAPISYALDMKVNFIGNGKDNHNQCVILGANKEISPWPGFVIRRLSSIVEQDQNPNTGYGSMNTIITITQSQENLNVTTHNVTTTLFCGLDGSGTPFRFSETRMYYCKIWSQGVLVRDLVPCLNSENIAGLYDLVNNVFYPSQGSEQFVYQALSS